MFGILRVVLACSLAIVVTGCTKSREDQVIDVDGKTYRITRIVHKQSTASEEYYELQSGPFRRECANLETCVIMLRAMRPELREKFLAGAPIVQPNQSSGISQPAPQTAIQTPLAPVEPSVPVPFEQERGGHR